MGYELEEVGYIKRIREEEDLLYPEAVRRLYDSHPGIDCLTILRALEIEADDVFSEDVYWMGDVLRKGTDATKDEIARALQGVSGAEFWEISSAVFSVWDDEMPAYDEFHRVLSGIGASEEEIDEDFEDSLGLWIVSRER